MTAPWMPPLPEPVGEIPYRRPSGMIGRLAGYAADQMRDYGIACARAALEQAAKVCRNERCVYSDEEWRIRCGLADAIAIEQMSKEIT